MTAKRQIRIQGDVAEVPLTKGFVAKIDVADVALVAPYSWSAVINGGTKTRVYASARIGGRRRSMHRHLLATTDSKLQVDHINHDPLDNRRSNLRVVTQSQNQFNRPPTKSNRTGFSNVRWCKINKHWTARAGKLWLGNFSTKEEAIEARRQFELSRPEDFGWRYARGQE